MSSLTQFLLGARPLRETILTSGANTFTALTATKLLLVTAVGAGGGGGGGAYNFNNTSSTYDIAHGGTGGGGGAVIDILIPILSSSSFTYSVGAAGTGGAGGAAGGNNNGSNGVAGGDTVFGSLVARGGGRGTGGVQATSFLSSERNNVSISTRGYLVGAANPDYFIDLDGGNAPNSSPMYLWCPGGSGGLSYGVDSTPFYAESIPALNIVGAQSGVVAQSGGWNVGGGGAGGCSRYGAGPAGYNGIVAGAPTNGLNGTVLGTGGAGGHGNANTGSTSGNAANGGNGSSGRIIIREYA